MAEAVAAKEAAIGQTPKNKAKSPPVIAFIIASHYKPCPGRLQANEKWFLPSPQLDFSIKISRGIDTPRLRHRLQYSGSPRCYLVPHIMKTETLSISSLIERLDEAVEKIDVRALCQEIKRALIETVGSGQDLLAAEFLRSSSEKYARRLLHKDPADRYSVVVMVWGPGQGTPLHDHAGRWGVECVYRGRIRVTSYDLEPAAGAMPLRFKRVSEIVAGAAEAGMLIPPQEYHEIANVAAEPSVTIHVYCGEMTWYNAYLPTPGGYRQERRETYYTA